MPKKLQFSRIDLLERSGALMLVSFLDDAGDLYQWAPKWSDIDQIYQKQINVERFNKPQSAWLNKFAKTAQSIVEGAQRITSARKIGGVFERYNLSKLEIGNVCCTPAFEVTVSFLDSWLGRQVEAFLLNDVVIRLRRYDEDEAGNVETRDYPPPEEDLPFE